MKITKDYEGIVRKKSGDYYISGSIVTKENIKIELDDRLQVEGSIISEKGIESNTTLIAGGGIKAGDGIDAGDGIYAKTYIDCGKRIFAGTSIYENEEAEKTISCAELRNGLIAYGELIVTEDKYE